MFDSYRDLFLKSKRKEAISTLVSAEDLLAELPAGFGKSLIFRVFIRIKKVMTGKPSSVVAVCLLQRFTCQFVSFTIEWKKNHQID